ncbi:LAME_0C07910g1_1 [Lachancea meyersii CBS 8951]|uniref:LAME_0C07910g1_1 n=1 Tax=Lachancea meyersii CBS 8951 TaxID=1266667 RepID=A0A1G4J311_9SACH|nr:LAME_0C07910g1_1 [Lachancea meyersii CBS 8951]
MGSCLSKKSSKDGSRPANSSATQTTRRARNSQAFRSNESHHEAKTKEKNAVAGKTLGGATEKDFPARRAAGLAAAERFEKSQKELKNGELGKKLAKERAKTLNAHLKDNAESRRTEKETALVYD